MEFTEKKSVETDLMLMWWNPEGRGFYCDCQKSLFPIFQFGTYEMSWACFVFPRTSNFLSLESFRGRSSEVLWEGLKFILKFWHKRENCQSRRFLLRFCFLYFFFQFRMISIYVQILLIILFWNADCQMIPRIEECGLSCSQVISYLFQFAVYSYSYMLPK